MVSPTTRGNKSLVSKSVGQIHGKSFSETSTSTRNGRSVMAASAIVREISTGSAKLGYLNLRGAVFLRSVLK